MYALIKNNTLQSRHKTLDAARDALAEIRKAALKQGDPCAYNGKDALESVEHEQGYNDVLAGLLIFINKKG